MGRGWGYGLIGLTKGDHEPDVCDAVAQEAGRLGARAREARQGLQSEAWLALRVACGEGRLEGGGRGG